jgi:hypothetical protein
MRSMVVKRYRNTNALNLRGAYKKPYVRIAQIPDHKDGHYVRQNKIAFKYPNLKKYDDLDVHVRMFNSAVKTNVDTFDEYIINAFNYMQKNITMEWCHNYMSKFLDYIFSDLHMHFANAIGRFKMTSKYTWS